MPDQNRFLQGPFAPVTKEITAFGLPVTGQVPAGLSGRYLRNGPNPLGLDDPNYHWFLGAGMVHGVRLRDGKAEWQACLQDLPEGGYVPPQFLGGQVGGAGDGGARVVGRHRSAPSPGVRPVSRFRAVAWR